jgi:hypothetical protein
MVIAKLLKKPFFLEEFEESLAQELPLVKRDWLETRQH